MSETATLARVRAFAHETWGGVYLTRVSERNEAFSLFVVMLHSSLGPRHMVRLDHITQAITEEV